MNGKNGVKKNDINMKDLKKKLKVVEGKSKTPTIPSYEILYEEFKNGIKFKPALLGGGFNKAFDEDINRILSLLDKHKGALDEIEDAILLFIHDAIRIKPQIYIARTKDIKTDIEYFTAKTIIPIKGGKKKEIKVYVGKAEDFNHNTKSPEAKLKGEKIMRATIVKQGDDGLVI
jgi:hypothetical protein